MVVSINRRGKIQAIPFRFFKLMLKIPKHKKSTIRNNRQKFKYFVKKNGTHIWKPAMELTFDKFNASKRKLKKKKAIQMKFFRHILLCDIALFASFET